MTAEQAAIERAPLGVTELPFPGGWIAVVGKRVDAREAFVGYRHVNDDARYCEAIVLRAYDFVMA